MEAPARLERSGVIRHPSWFDELQLLTARFSGFGIGPDLVGLTLADAWGMYRFLQRLACGGADG